MKSIKLPKDLRIIMSNNYDLLYAQLSTSRETVSIEATFDDKVVPGNLMTYTNREKNVCLINNVRSNLMAPKLIGIKYFNLNILGAIMSIVNKKLNNSAIQKDFWIGISYLSIYGFKRIWELSEKVQIIIYSYLLYSKDNPIPRTFKNKIVIDITSRVEEHISILYNLLIEKGNEYRDEYYDKGVEKLKETIDINHQTFIKANKKVLLRKANNLNSELFYNPAGFPSIILINYNDEKKKLNLLYLFDIESKESIRLTFLYEFFKSYEKTKELNDNKFHPTEFVNLVMEKIDIELEDANAFYDFVNDHQLLKD